MTSAELFEQMASRLNQDPARIEGLTATFRFELSGDDGGAFTVRVADGRAELASGDAGAEDADVTLAMDADDFKAMARGDLNATSAFMSGKLRIRGDLGLAMRLGSLLS